MLESEKWLIKAAIRIFAPYVVAAVIIAIVMVSCARAEGLEAPERVTASPKGPVLTDYGCYEFGRFSSAAAWYRDHGLPVERFLGLIPPNPIKPEYVGMGEVLQKQTVLIYNSPLTPADALTWSAHMCRDLSGRTWMFSSGF